VYICLYTIICANGRLSDNSPRSVVHPGWPRGVKIALDGGDGLMPDDCHYGGNYTLWLLGKLDRSSQAIAV
jgi:hypothetical protein